MNSKALVLMMRLLILLALSVELSWPAPAIAGIVTRGRSVRVVDGQIKLAGFIVSGGYSPAQSEAISRHGSLCGSLSDQLYSTLDRNRIIKKIECGRPANESPFGSGFMYVSHPTLDYVVDPEDTIVEIDGPKITGEEGDQARLYHAFTSFNEECMRQIELLKTKYSSQFVAATCGEAKVSRRDVYWPSHGQSLPSLTLSSMMKVYLRRVASGSKSKVETLELTAAGSIPITDSITALIPAHTGATTSVVTVGFAGSISKLDLKSRKIVWDKNLTNPDPASVRMTTPLNAVTASTNGQFIATGGDYGYLAILSGATGEKISVLSCDKSMFADHHYVALSFAQADRTLISVAMLSQIPPTDTSYNKLNFPDVSPRASKKHKVSHWNLESSIIDWSVELVSGPVLKVGFNKDESMMYVAATDRIIVLRTLTGELIREFPLAMYEGKMAGSVITGAGFSADFRLLAISAFSGVIVIDTQTGKLFRRLRADLTSDLGSPGISSDNKIVTANDAFGGVFQWQTHTGNLVAHGRNDKMGINSNGPPLMPIISLSEKVMVVGGMYREQGTVVSFPPLNVPPSSDRLCKTGPNSDLPALKLRKSGLVSVWMLR